MRRLSENQLHAQKAERDMNQESICCLDLQLFLHVITVHIIIRAEDEQADKSIISTTKTQTFLGLKIRNEWVVKKKDKFICCRHIMADSFPSFLPLPFRSIRVHQCWVSLWRASCWGRPPPSCSPFSHHWTVPWRLFMTRAAQGGGHWRSPRTCPSRGSNGPADASRRTCVSPLLTPTLAC